MGKIHEEKAYGLLLREGAIDGSDFGTPAADFRYFWLGEDGRLYTKDSAAAVAVAGSGSELNYVAITADVPLAGASEAAATTVVTSGSVTYDGATPIVIEFVCSNVQFIAATIGNGLTLDLYEDSTILGRIAKVIPEVISVTTAVPVNAKLRRTPASGAHTYTVKGWKQAAGDTATVKAGAGGTGAFVASFIRITRA